MSIYVSYIDCQPYVPPAEEEYNKFLAEMGWTKEERESVPPGIIGIKNVDAYIKAHRKQE
jgi:hypothetical protein